jgi:hypothetical protein
MSDLDHPEDEESIPDEHGGEVGDAVRRAAGDGEDLPTHDADDGGEVGDAIRRSADDD